MNVSFMANRTFSLLCQDCDTVFITYDPNAERGHPISLGAVTSDAARHAKECPFAASVVTPSQTDKQPHPDVMGTSAHSAES